MRNQYHKKQCRWIIYILLILIRFLGIFQRGYIHPDEFFQGGQELFFGHRYQPQLLGGDEDYIVKNLPWEFEPRHAVRSIVPPIFMTLLPLRLYAISRQYVKRLFLYANYETTNKMLEEENEGDIIDTPLQKSFVESSILWSPAMDNLSGKEILLIPRLFMAILSVLFLDGSLWILVMASKKKQLESMKRKSISRFICSVYHIEPPIEVIVLASSWTCLAFGVRLFTNNLEAMVLAFLLVLVVLSDASTEENEEATNKMTTKKAARMNNITNGGAVSLIMIGITCSLGIFVRFTFLFFAFPVVAIFLWHRWKGLEFKLTCIIQDGMLLAFSFLFVSCGFIWVDTQYYTWQTNSFDDTLVCGDNSATTLSCMMQFIAPFNAFRYNSKSTNLAEHGLHPRITHAAVNMPILFGPLALVGYTSLFEHICGIIAIRRGKGTTYSASYSFTETICKWSILAGLLVLSCAPHQEPRFLMPSIVPLAFLNGHQVVGTGEIKRGTNYRVAFPKWVLSSSGLWIMFNLILFIFFGWLHQGGLLDSLLHLNDSESRYTIESDDQTSRITIYYKTYMPPTFLTNERNENSCQMHDEDHADETCFNYLQHRTDVIIDLQGSESSVLLEALRKWLPCQGRDVGGRDAVKNISFIESGFLQLVSPPTIIQSLVEEQDESSTTMKWEEYSIVPTREYHAHISTEDWPAFDGLFLGQLKLDLYSVSCT